MAKASYAGSDTESRPLRKHTLNLYEGDYERLRTLFDTDPSRVVRQLVRKTIEGAEGKKTSVPDIEL